MEESQVKSLIEDNIDGATAFIADNHGGGDHFNAVVISDHFNGKTTVQQHQLVYKACGEYLTREIHALQLKTYTPEQWAEQNLASKGE